MYDIRELITFVEIVAVVRSNCVLRFNTYQHPRHTSKDTVASVLRKFEYLLRLCGYVI